MEAHKAFYWRPERAKAQPYAAYRLNTEKDVYKRQELPFDAVDLCAVFANGLDNAIEACDKVREQNRFIKMTAKTEKGLLALKITNAFAGNLETKHGLPTTTKKSKDHGFGPVSYTHLLLSALNRSFFFALLSVIIATCPTGGHDSFLSFLPKNINK